MRLWRQSAGSAQTRHLPYRQEVKEQQALHVVDADPSEVFVEQVGDQIQAAYQLPEFSFKTQVGNVAGYFVGQ